MNTSLSSPDKPKKKPVIADGGAPNVIQAPSPVFCAQWIDESHVLLGAGGGGARFGMVNMLALAEVDTIQKTFNGQQSKGTGGSSSALWNLVDYVDLKDNIPWCCTPLLPFDPDSDTSEWGDGPRRAAQEHAAIGTIAEGVKEKGKGEIIGFVAVSGVRSFTLVSVHKHLGRNTQDNLGQRQGGQVGGNASSYSYSLHRRAVIPLPCDENNPDKKPISLLSNVVVVGHDDGDVLLYSLASLLTPRSGLSTLNADEEGLFPLTTSAVPLARWKLHSRANDLHANWMDMSVVTYSHHNDAALSAAPSAGQSPSRGDSSGTSRGEKTLHMLDYVVVAALTHDKTLRIASFRLRGGGAADGRKKKKKLINNPMNAADELEDVPLMVEQCVLNGSQLGLNFQLMRSSLRLVRLFGLEELACQGAANSSLLLRIQDRLARSLEKEKESTPCEKRDAILVEQPDAIGLLLVAYDQRENTSYFVEAQLDAKINPPKNTAVQEESDCIEAKNQQKERVLMDFDEDGEGNSKMTKQKKNRLKNQESKYGTLQLTLRLVRQPAKVVQDDAISFVSEFHSVQDTHGDSGKMAVGGNGTTGGKKVSSGSVPNGRAGSVSGGRRRMASKTAEEKQQKLRRQRELQGSFIPREWIVSTVEGRVVRVRDLPIPLTAGASIHQPPPPPGLASDSMFTPTAQRPPRGSRALTHFYPLLHENPITCVAVSKRNDVVTTDIAQKIVITTMEAPRAPTHPQGSARQSPVLSTESSSEALEKVPQYSLFAPEDGWPLMRCYLLYFCHLLRKYWYLLAILIAILTTLVYRVL